MSGEQRKGRFSVGPSVPGPVQETGLMRDVCRAEGGCVQASSYWSQVSAGIGVEEIRTYVARLEANTRDCRRGCEMGEGEIKAILETSVFRGSSEKKPGDGRRRRAA